MLIDGKKIAAEIVAELRVRPSPSKKLVAVLVGDDESSVRFVRKKRELAASLCVNFETKNFPANMAAADLIKEVETLSADVGVGGIIVQLPLPIHIERRAVLDIIAPEKDVDCLGGKRLERFYGGDFSLVSPTVAAVRSILFLLDITDLRGKRAAVVGAGILVGQPVAHWFKTLGASVDIIDSDLGLADRQKAFQGADIIVSGVGQAGLIKGDDIKIGAIVIDFGFPADVDLASVLPKATWVTPTPGGTGPIVVAELFRNFYQLNSH